LIPPAVYLNIIQADSAVDTAEADSERLRDSIYFEVSAWDPEQGAWLNFDRLAPFKTAKIPRLMTRVDGRDEIRLRMRALPIDEDGARELFEGVKGICWEPKLSIGDEEASTNEVPVITTSSIIGMRPGVAGLSAILPPIERGSPWSQAYP
jgi:hypothetical protein